MRLIQHGLVIGVGTVLVILVFTGKLSWLGFAGVLLTLTSTMATWFFLSAAKKTKKAFDQGDYKTNRGVDVTAANREPPPVIHPSILALTDLGFRRLGEEATVSAEGKELGSEWALISSDGQVLAGLVPGRGMPGGLLAGFQTNFPDYASLVTMYPSGFPLGETITLPDFRLRHTRRSLLDAYELHRAELADFAQQHGEPMHIRRLADALAFEPIYRERYMGLTLRRGAQIGALQPYFWGSGVPLFLVGTLLSSVAPALAILIFVLGFSVVCLYLSYMVPAYPRPALWFRLAVVLALALLPLSFMWHPFVLAHIALLSLLLIVLNRYLPAEARALADEIQAGKTDADWQVGPPGTSGQK
jgi:hypothetical protein